MRRDELRFKSINKLTQKMAKLVSDSFTNFQNAETDINKENEYELPMVLTPEIFKAEVYNKKTNKYREVDFFVCLKIIKPLKTDKKLKIYYE